MLNKSFFTIASFFIVIISYNNLLYGAEKLDHKIFIDKIENSNNILYDKYLSIYNDYLEKNPDDIAVQIERCKYVQFAQYNIDEDFNPNQAYFDSCVSVLTKKYPFNPEVILFQTTYLWGEDLINTFKKADTSFVELPNDWTNKTKGEIYFKKAEYYYYYEDNNKEALKYISTAIKYDKKYEASLEYASILFNNNLKEKTLKVLQAVRDTTGDAWLLGQKADLYLKLEQYDEALEVYKEVEKIDSSYNNNAEIAKTFEGNGQYNLARIYLTKDTSLYWSKEDALRRLLEHDLKFQSSKLALESYNEFRDIGFSTDPLGLYRLKLFFQNPLLAWELNHFGGLILFLLTIALFIILPSIWILPVYFIGHKWKLKHNLDKFNWGLKSFWIISSGYLIATLLSSIVSPQHLYSSFSDYPDYEHTLIDEGKTFVVFVSVMALLTIYCLRNTNINIFFSKNWSVTRNILMPLALFIAFRLIIGFYVLIGAKLNISPNDITCLKNGLLASNTEIKGVLEFCGYLIGFLIIGGLIPIYEEIIFRGAILESCQRYTNFVIANLIQATLFGILHMSLFLFPIFFLFGITSGILRKKSGGLLAGILLHIFNNSLVILVLIARMS